MERIETGTSTQGRKSCYQSTLIPQPLLPKREKGSRKALSGLPLAQFWERGTEGVRAEMWVHGSALGERGLG